jgi:hypothetical protein
VQRLTGLGLAVAAAMIAAPAAAPAQPAPDPTGGGDTPAPGPTAAPAPDPGTPPVAAPTAMPPTTTPPAATPPPGPGSSDAAAAPSPDGVPDDVGDQALSAQIGLATGGRVTPGGLQIAGHYLYQLSARDWFDGTASFTFGSSRAACFRDRQDAVICSHGVADGSGVELTGAVRRLFAPQGQFRPFARVGAGIGLARFGDDSVTGATFRLHGGGGVRVAVTPSFAIVADGDLALGFGSFSRGLGSQPQLGLVITVGGEFRLR